MDQSLTVVLPMYNNERQIRRSISELLELSHTVTRSLDVIIVDDGSTDDTYESACELARIYPQVTVLRQPVRRGLASALERVRDRIAPETVVVHDGVSPIDSAQLRILLENDPWGERSAEGTGLRNSDTIDSAGSRRFASIRTLHQSMEIAHRNVVGFSWMQLAEPMIPRRRSPENGRRAATAIPMLSTDGGAVVFPAGIATGPIA